MHWIGIIISLVIIGSSFLIPKTEISFFMVGLGILIGVFPFMFSIIRETNISAEKEEMFLEFTRNLVESVKTGTPISKSIINVKNKPYGVLSENIKKLANQIELGIPLSFALKVFSEDVKNKTISRTLTLIGQTEKAGGDIGEILESVAEAVIISDKLKKERKASISTLIVQGYIIFFVFMIIILVVQFWVFPMLSGIGEIDVIEGFDGTKGEVITAGQMASAFLYLLLVQGFFSGLAIGKVAEGNVKRGVKHSFILMVSSFLVSATANLFFAV